MKLLFLPAQPMLTKRGKPRKRGGTRQPGRIFLESGHELPIISRLSLEGSDPVSVSLDGSRAIQFKRSQTMRLTLEFDNADVTIIDKAPQKEST